jgi:hypothetical protein
MYQPVENWPVKKDFTPPPIEECRKDVTQATCAVARMVGERLTYPSKASTRAKLVRIFGYVMMAVAAFKKQPGRIALIKTGTSGGKLKPGPPPRCYLEAALDYLVEDAQRNMNLEGMASLEAEEIIREHEVGPPRRIKVVMARREKYLRVAYDAEALPILPHNHPPVEAALAGSSCSGSRRDRKHDDAQPSTCMDSEGQETGKKHQARMLHLQETGKGERNTEDGPPAGAPHGTSPRL